MASNHSLLRQGRIFVREAALDPQTCAGWLAGMEASRGAPAEIYAQGGELAIDERTRRTRSVEPPETIVSATDAFLDALRPALEAHFQLTLTTHEPPHYLLYREGDFFGPHRDRSRASDTATSARRVAGVLFLNDSFSGGDLRFYGLVEGTPWDTVGFPCPAATGLFVAFAADTLHDVAPVTAGVRGTVVTWFS